MGTEIDTPVQSGLNSYVVGQNSWNPKSEHGLGMNILKIYMMLNPGNANISDTLI